MRGRAQACTTAYERKASARTYIPRACATVHDDAFPECTGMMAPPTVLRFSCRRGAAKTVKIATISRAEGGQLQAPVGRARACAVPVDNRSLLPAYAMNL